MKSKQIDTFLKEVNKGRTDGLEVVFFETWGGGYYRNQKGYVSYPRDQTAWCELLVLVPAGTEIKRKNDKNIIEVLVERNCYSTNGSGWQKTKDPYVNILDQQMIQIAKENLANILC